MKINKWSFLLPIFFAVTIYLISAYIAGSFNILTWDEFGRFFSGFIMLGSVIIGIALSQEIKN